MKNNRLLSELTHAHYREPVPLTDALPTPWRESLKSCISIGDTPFNLRDEIKVRLSGQTVLLEKAYSKIVYKELRNRIVTPPTAKLKFDALLLMIL